MKARGYKGKSYELQKKKKTDIKTKRKIKKARTRKVKKTKTSGMSFVPYLKQSNPQKTE